MEHDVTALRHGVGFGLLVAADLPHEDAANGLAVGIDQRKRQLGLGEAVLRQIGRFLGGDLVALQAVKIREEAADRGRVGILGAVDLPARLRRLRRGCGEGDGVVSESGAGCFTKR